MNRKPLSFEGLFLWVGSRILPLSPFGGAHPDFSGAREDGKVVERNLKGEHEFWNIANIGRWSYWVNHARPDDRIGQAKRPRFRRRPALRCYEQRGVGCLRVAVDVPGDDRFFYFNFPPQINWYTVSVFSVYLNAITHFRLYIRQLSFLPASNLFLHSGNSRLVKTQYVKRYSSTLSINFNPVSGKYSCASHSATA